MLAIYPVLDGSSLKAGRLQIFTTFRYRWWWDYRVYDHQAGLACLLAILEETPFRIVVGIWRFELNDIICHSTFYRGPGSSVVVQKGESLSKDNTLFGLGPLFEECREWPLTSRRSPSLKKNLRFPSSQSILTSRTWNRYARFRLLTYKSILRTLDLSLPMWKSTKKNRPFVNPSPP